MNRATYLKHKPVMEWFYEEEGRSILFMNDSYHDDIEWYKTEQPVWDARNTYVINDEYIELRKAQAEGKVIQHHRNNTFPSISVWIDITVEAGFSCGHENYRIKPDKPEFKVGDWVRHPDGPTFNFKFEEEYIEDQPFIGDFELWEPKVGDEVVWLDMCSPRIVKLAKFNIPYANTLLSKDKCFPYIGQPFEEMK